MLTKETFLRCEETMTVIGGMEVERVGGFERPPRGSRPQRIATTTQVRRAETGRGLQLQHCLLEVQVE